MVLNVGDSIKLVSRQPASRRGEIVGISNTHIQVRWHRPDGHYIFTYHKEVASMFKVINHYKSKLGKILYGE